MLARSGSFLRLGSGYSLSGHSAAPPLPSFVERFLSIVKKQLSELKIE